eukprot:m.33064 g.33064  ORF g.33064 m.33064 type:complete len:73 (+) comp8484_c0_seq1:1156-1374(+)
MFCVSSFMPEPYTTDVVCSERVLCNNCARSSAPTLVLICVQQVDEGVLVTTTRLPQKVNINKNNGYYCTHSH